jgi:hypothetical protein
MAGSAKPDATGNGSGRSWTIPLSVNTSGLDVVLSIVVTLVNEYGAVVQDVDVRDAGGSITLLLDAESLRNRAAEVPR